MAGVEGGINEGGRPVMRRYIKDVDGSVSHERYEGKGGLTFSSNPEEGRLRFIAALQHAGIVRMLLDLGGQLAFNVDADILDDFAHYQIGIRTAPGSGIGEMFLIRKPEEDTGDLT